MSKHLRCDLLTLCHILSQICYAKKGRFVLVNETYKIYFVHMLVQVVNIVHKTTPYRWGEWCIDNYYYYLKIRKERSRAERYVSGCSFCPRNQIQTSKVAWHIERHPENIISKRIWSENLQLGKDLRWQNNILSDLATMRYIYKPKMTEDCQHWRWIVNPARIYSGLLKKEVG